MKITGPLLSAVLALAALTSAGAQERFVFTPQWTAQAQFAGYYVALEEGFYKEVGLDVEIKHPSSTTPALETARQELCQATTLQLCQAMEIIDGGLPLVNILQTSMNNALVIVSRWGKDPLTQKGARVGIWSIGFGQIARCMDQKENLGYEWIMFASSNNLFIKGAIDATLAMSYNEYYQLLQTGISITEDSVYRFSEHDYNIQEDGVYMTRSYYLKHKDQARRFAQASRRGWEWAAEHPEETLEIVMKYVSENHIATNRVLQKLMLDEVLRLQIDRESGEREFRVRPDMLQRANDLMLESGALRKAVSYDQLVAAQK